MITIMNKSISGVHNGVFDAGESRKEAIELGLKLYIGKSCEYGHYAQTETGEKINGTLRRTSGDCVRCSSRRTSNVRHNDNMELHSNEARKRIEDIKMARELGISVDDL